MANVIAYRVLDTPYNRKHYPTLIGKGFSAPPDYGSIMSYRAMKTEGFNHPPGFIPRETTEDEVNGTVE